MILNIQNLDMAQKSMWAHLARELEKLGYNLKVATGRATVMEKESGNVVGEVPRDMIQDEEVDYILYSRLQLQRKIELQGGNP